MSVSTPPGCCADLGGLHSVQFSALSERGADADWTVKFAGRSVQIQCSDYLRDTHQHTLQRMPPCKR
jgi:hypothetical protein